MPRLTVRIPKYRLHKASGQAVVTIDGRDVYLGRHNSTQSKVKYNRVIAESRLTAAAEMGAAPDESFTVDQLILAFLTHAGEYYVKNGRPTSSQNMIRTSLRPLHLLYGGWPCKDIGPRAINALRQMLIARHDWSRRTINDAVGIIKRMFKWGAENELIPAELYHRLQTVSGLRRGRTAAREMPPIKPVSEDHALAVLDHVSPQVGAMIQLQLLTGMRPGEVIAMRGCDLDTSGELWAYTPASHKTEHHHRERVIYLGPRAQSILEPFLKRDLSAFLFSPREAEESRRSTQHARRQTPLSYGNRPGTNKKRRPRWNPSDAYTVASYRRAIERGCEKAFPPPEHLRPRVWADGKRESQRAFMSRLTKDEKDELRAWHREHRWHPNRLRHTAATRLRKQFGIEAARVVLGHSSAVVTEIYAEVDREKASQIMNRVG